MNSAFLRTDIRHAFCTCKLALTVGWLIEAAALLVGYDELLCIIELLTLRVADVKGNFNSPSLILELHDTKNSAARFEIRPSDLQPSVLTQ